MNNWKVFLGDGQQHDGLTSLPSPPPWRFAGADHKIEPATGEDKACKREEARASSFRPTDEMILAVNAALHLRRPLLLTGKPGSGKSTLISKVAHELFMGPVLRWPVNSRTTVRNGVYEYDAVGRLQAGGSEVPPVKDYLTLGPLGTALAAKSRPRALLIDEIDKSDLDFANDLLNVIEEGEYEIPELRRLTSETVAVRDALDQFVEIKGGRLMACHFPFVVMTSNGEREFPAPFLRRCIRLSIDLPGETKLKEIVEAHLKLYSATLDLNAVDTLIKQFLARRQDGDVATDQLLNAVFLTVAMPNKEARTFDNNELKAVREALLRQLGDGL